MSPGSVMSGQARTSSIGSTDPIEPVAYEPMASPAPAARRSDTAFLMASPLDASPSALPPAAGQRRET